MIPVNTPTGTHRVWVKRIGNNPHLRLLLAPGCARPMNPGNGPVVVADGRHGAVAEVVNRYATRGPSG